MTTPVLAPPAPAAVCPACNAGLRPAPAPARPAGPVPAPEPYVIARAAYGTPHPVRSCSACGLGWAEVPYSRETVLDAYEEAEDPAYAAEEAARRRTFRRALARLLPHARGRRLLDVGASLGFLLVEARELGFDVCGLEPSPWAARAAKSLRGLDVVEGSLETAPFEPGSFDVVTLVDVVEHLVDPFAGLKAAARLLAPEGVIYIVTPDLGSLSARILGRRWWGFEPWHLWYFTRRSLQLALEASGFRVVETYHRYPRTFTVDYWLSKGEGLAPGLGRRLRDAAHKIGLGKRQVTLALPDTVVMIARKAGAR